MNIFGVMFFIIAVYNRVFLISFSILTIISLLIFKILFNKKLNNKPVKYEGLIIIFNTLLLIVSMLIVVLSGWYALLQYCY